MYMLTCIAINFRHLPDIVWWDTKRRVLLSLKLVLRVEAALRKTAKYIDLVNQAKNNSYNANLLTLQVGSRGAGSV